MRIFTNAINGECFSLSKDDDDALLRKIEIALEQVNSGDFLTEEEFDEEVEKWFKESE